MTKMPPINKIILLALVLIALLQLSLADPCDPLKHDIKFGKKIYKRNIESYEDCAKVCGRGKWSGNNSLSDFLDSGIRCCCEKTFKWANFGNNLILE